MRSIVTGGTPTVPRSVPRTSRDHCTVTGYKLRSWHYTPDGAGGDGPHYFHAGEGWAAERDGAHVFTPAEAARLDRIEGHRITAVWEPVLRLDGPPLDAAAVADALARPGSFAYSGERAEMFRTWSLGPVIEHRDSDLVDVANARALRDYLGSDPSLAEDWDAGECSHWAVGWVEHLTYRAAEADGSASRMARVVAAWFDALSDYPLAPDAEDALGVLELDALADNVESAAAGMLRDDPPDGWVGDVVQWLDAEGYGCCTENTDGRGAYPCDEHLAEALESLGLADPEAVA